MDGGAWWAAVHGVLKSQTRLSDFTFPFHFHALEKETATHSSVLAWRIPGTGEPDGLPSMGSHRVGLDWSDLAAAASQNALQKKGSRNGYKGKNPWSRVLALTTMRQDFHSPSWCNKNYTPTQRTFFSFQSHWAWGSGSMAEYWILCTHILYHPAQNVNATLH